VKVQCPFVLAPRKRPIRKQSPGIATESLYQKTKPLTSEIVSRAKNLQQATWVYFVGHPGAGKTTILDVVKTLLNTQETSFWHVDDYIDWSKLVEWVDATPNLDENDYVRVANRAVLNLALTSGKTKAVNFIDGAGLMYDMNEIFEQQSIHNILFIMVDAPDDILRNRLALRGDNFIVTEKEASERRANLTSIHDFNSLYINTKQFDLCDPYIEISYLFQGILDCIIKRA